MDITNPEAIRFCNEVVRPLAESMRALKARADAAAVQWFATISAEVPNDSSPVLDDREDEGVSRLVGSDVVGLMTQLLAYQTQLNASGVAAVIQKPCVSVLNAS